MNIIGGVRTHTELGRIDRNSKRRGCLGDQLLKL